MTKFMRKHTFIVTLVILVMILVNAGFTMYHFRRVLHAGRWLVHTHEVRLDIARLEADISSGNVDMVAVDSTRRPTRDDPIQQAIVMKMGKSIEAIDIENKNDYKRASRKAREPLRQMDADEVRLLRVRTKEVDTSIYSCGSGLPSLISWPFPSWRSRCFSPRVEHALDQFAVSGF